MPIQKALRGPGVEPGSIAWKATMLTATPSTLCYRHLQNYYVYKQKQLKRFYSMQSKEQQHFAHLRPDSIMRIVVEWRNI
ncbi:hypothetical protein T10_1232 [Trichinella papuae]|uniref:Uncharacterized protein n=1 Tax=Trichinella papuae TaxID=268474 RepID=A0A0V1N320_9BILA|nr:hypothetical protein T10_1232 [Trichinella papuae]